MDKNVRMADIAEKLGISVVSVSKGLSGKDGVSEELRVRILQTAAEMGYIAKNDTKETETAAARNIGVLVPDRFFDDNTFYSNLYRLLVKEFTASGCSVLLEIISPESEIQNKIPVSIIGKKVDALIFMGEVDISYLETITSCNLPFLLLDFFNEKFPADCILSDNIHGGYLMTDLLLKEKYRKIGFVGGIKETSSNMDRFLGYTKALLKADIFPRFDWILEDRTPDGHYIKISLPEEIPEAFVCCNDETAYNLITELRARGLRVPEDIAVTGYDDFRFATLSQPSLTTYHVDIEGMAKRSVELILQKLEGKKSDPVTTVVCGETVVRDSVIIH